MSRKDNDLLPPEQFLSVLEELVGHDHRLDLLLVSGRTLSDEPDARELAQKAAGMPVAFEVVNRNGSGRWLLGNGGSPQPILLRRSQILFKSSDSEDTYKRFVAELEAGYGIIRHGANGVKLVLLICGENNALRWQGSDLSALYYPSAGLPDVLGAPWLVLNPAHSPYWPQIRSKGFAKVGQVAGSGETMARPVARARPYKDGTTSPVAFIHANNFFPDEPRTKAYASVAFNAAGRMTTTRTADGTIPGRDSKEIHWFLSAYEIAI